MRRPNSRRTLCVTLPEVDILSDWLKFQAGFDVHGDQQNDALPGADGAGSDRNQRRPVLGFRGWILCGVTQGENEKLTRGSPTTAIHDQTP